MRRVPAPHGRIEGLELLDKIIKSLPEGVATKVITVVAKERFGIDLTVSTVSLQGGGSVEDMDQDYVEHGKAKTLSTRTGPVVSSTTREPPCITRP